MVVDDMPGRIMVSGLRKSFGAVVAVKDLSFSVEPGSVTGFLGPNGAGKTTTLRMLLGLVRPDAGTATIGGRSYVGLPAPASEVGAVLEASGLHPARSGRDHLRVYSSVGGYGSVRVDEVLELVGLAAAGRRPVRGYSLGMRQRLALAAALLGDPQVLVLDEPTGGLDPEGIAWIRSLLREFAVRGRTVLVSTHVLSEVEQLADRVVIVNGGTLVWQGTLARLAASGGDVVLVRTPSVDALLAALRCEAGDEIEAVRTGPDTVRVSGVPAAHIGDLAFAAGVPIQELRPERDGARLEAAFFALTGSRSGEWERA